jgi:cytochrome c oxidase cbb3-type subunit 4
MDLDVIRGIVLVMLIIGFLGLWAWAWSKKRKPEFDYASRLPLEEDRPGSPDNNGGKE